jgi:hypothetical protein
MSLINVRRCFWAILLLSVSLSFSGCCALNPNHPDCQKTQEPGGGGRNPDAPPSPHSPSAPPARPKIYRFGYSVERQPIRGPVFGDGNNVNTTMIIASIHGDEAAGTPLVEEFGEYLRKNPRLWEGQRIVLMPNVNPDAVRKGVQNNARNIDINHDFFNKNPQPETKAIIAAIEKFSPDRIISIRQLGAIDYDGPGAKEIAEKITYWMQLPIKRWGISPGSLGRFGTELGIPVITLGLEKNISSKRQIQDRFQKAMQAAISLKSTTDSPEPPSLVAGKQYFYQKKFDLAANKFSECRKSNEDCNEWLRKSIREIQKIIKRGEYFFGKGQKNLALRELQKCKEYAPCGKRWRQINAWNPPPPPPGDQCPDDPQKRQPGQCGCGNPDTDRDGDGIADCDDDCPEDPEKSEPGPCGCGNPDTDRDGDGIADCRDECPEDPDKSAAGTCGCGQAETDSDADGSPDCIDECPDDPLKTAPGKCGCGSPEEICERADQLSNDYDTGLSLAEQGQLRKAKQRLFAVFQSNPGFKKVKFHLYRIQLNLLENLGTPQEASALSQFFCGSECGNLRDQFIQRHLAKGRELANEKNDLLGAKSEWELVLKVDPGNREAKDGLITIGQ